MKVNSHDPERLEVLNRRAFMFASGASLVLAVIAGRLYQLQIVEHQRYVRLAEDNQFNRRILTPLRGEIVDRFGVPLATNAKNFRLLFVPEQTRNIDAAFDEIGGIVPLSDEKRARIKRQIRRRAPYTPIEVESNLS